MSDCGVCLSSPEDGVIEMLYENEAQVSVSPYQCCECCRIIHGGETHQCHAGRYEGEHCEYRTCLICAEIRKAFACNGWNYCALWEDLESAFDEGVNESCFAKLTTVAAKKYLREHWRKWRGLASGSLSGKQR